MKRLFFLLLAFLLLLTAACNSPSGEPTRRPRATIVIREPTPRPSRTETADSASLPTNTLAPTPVSCPDAPPIRLILNTRGRVLNEDPRPLNVRAEPGIETDILGRIETEEIFYVLEGPVCADGYAWFYIRYGSLEGWIAEGDATSYYVEPFLAG